MIKSVFAPFLPLPHFAHSRAVSGLRLRRDLLRKAFVLCRCVDMLTGVVQGCFAKGSTATTFFAHVHVVLMH